MAPTGRREESAACFARGASCTLNTDGPKRRAKCFTVSCMQLLRERTVKYLCRQRKWMRDYGRVALQFILSESACPAAALDRTVVCNSSAGSSTDVQSCEQNGVSAEWGDGWDTLCQRMM